MTQTGGWLHVAAMPFPTQQGTQTAIEAMCTASVAEGRRTHLLTYAAREYERRRAFPVHRVGDFPRLPTLRSGPSAAKIVLDARMIVDLARLRRRLRPDVLVAHHVEAGAVTASTLPARRFILFLHTDLEAELPSYGPPSLTRPLAMAGRVTDRALARRAGRVATISPALADSVRGWLGEDARVRWVPVPWPLSPPVDAAARARAREALGLAQDAKVVLYAGNLDAYQGWEDVVGAMTRLALNDEAAVLLVGTASHPAPLHAEAARAGIGERLVVHSLGDEATRRWLHAAADVVVVPRRVPGGLPIKLLDALGRGSACVVAPAARAGLPLAGAVSVAHATTPEAMAHALGSVLASRDRRIALGAAGRAYIADAHAPARFFEALDSLSAPN